MRNKEGQIDSERRVRLEQKQDRTRINGMNGISRRWREIGRLVVFVIMLAMRRGRVGAGFLGF